MNKQNIGAIIGGVTFPVASYLIVIESCPTGGGICDILIPKPMLFPIFLMGTGLVGAIVGYVVANNLNGG